MRAISLLITALALAACATAPPVDEPERGLRREPCGGGPSFPIEEPAAPAQTER
jgi:hypothetical protein